MGLLEGILYMIWRGLAIGVIISAPMGPVGILCVQRTLEKGRLAGFCTGVGASLSDLIYCLLTGFGLSFIEEFLKANQTVIQIFGSIVLVIFGIYLFKSTPARKLKKPEVERTSKGKNVLSGFLFTFSNPLIIFLIIGLFARFDFFLPEISIYQYLVGYISIIVGALGWWWIVSYFVNKLRAHFNLRSMWLINKITGGIIMIFAIVGVITAFSYSADAAEVRSSYWNRTRGFGSFADNYTLGQPLIIDNKDHKERLRLIPIDSARDFTFSFRAANLNNASGKSYSYYDDEGKKYNVQNPAWGVILKGNDNNLKFIFSTIDRNIDAIYPSFLNVDYFSSAISGNAEIYDNIDLYKGNNSFRLDLIDGAVSLTCGNRKLSTVIEDLQIGFVPDSIGFIVTPGACISIDDIKFIDNSPSNISRPSAWSHFINEDVRKSYFKRSVDPIEGEWEIFDRMLEESKLRIGGNYRLAIVKRKGGYDLLYLDGATINKHNWVSGMIKAKMNETSFEKIYDMEWFDPDGRMIEALIKAQYVEPDIINIQFPDHDNSTLRLRRIKNHAQGL